MDVMTADDVGTRVMGLVLSIAEESAPGESVSAQTRLADIGFASVDMVNLMLAVEAEFDLMIPQNDITPENFQSVATIEQLIRRLR